MPLEARGSWADRDNPTYPRRGDELGDSERTSFRGIAGDHGVDLATQQQMASYIERNSNAQSEPLPRHWLEIEPVNYMGVLSQLADALLGETAGETWFKNLNEWKDYGSRGEDADEVSAPTHLDIDFSPLAQAFLSNNADFLRDYVERLSSIPQYRNDADKPREALLEGIAQALNPPENGRQDQRLNFFIEHPSYLQDAALKDVLRLLRDSSILVKLPAEINDPERWRSIYEAKTIRSNAAEGRRKKQKDQQLKKQILDLLTTVEGKLLRKLEVLAEEQNADLQNYVGNHILWRMKKARETEGNRKAREQSLTPVGDSEMDESRRGLQIAGSTLAVGVGDGNGVETVERSTLASSRSVTKLEHQRAVEAVREKLTTTIAEVEKLGNELVEKMRETGRNPKIEYSSVKYSDRKDRCVYVTDVLQAILELARLQTRELLQRLEDMDHEASAAELAKYGEYGLTKLINPKKLGDKFQQIAAIKQEIHAKADREGRNKIQASAVARQLGVSELFVCSTLNEDAAAWSFYKDLNSSKVKNYIGYRWTSFASFLFDILQKYDVETRRSLFNLIPIYAPYLDPTGDGKNPNTAGKTTPENTRRFWEIALGEPMPPHVASWYERRTAGRTTTVKTNE